VPEEPVEIGALQLDDALTVADGVLAALEAAQAKGWCTGMSVRRTMVDYPATGALRPADVRLVETSVWPTPFRRSTASDIVRSERTDTGRDGVLGVNYMSPEQAMGRPVGAGDLPGGRNAVFRVDGAPSSSPRYPSGRDARNIEAPPPVPSVGSYAYRCRRSHCVVTAMRGTADPKCLGHRYAKGCPRRGHRRGDP
jgi:hypothetical protein